MGSVSLGISFLNNQFKDGKEIANKLYDDVNRGGGKARRETAYFYDKAKNVMRSMEPNSYTTNCFHGNLDDYYIGKIKSSNYGQAELCAILAIEPTHSGLLHATLAYDATMPVNVLKKLGISTEETAKTMTIPLKKENQYYWDDVDLRLSKLDDDLGYNLFPENYKNLTDKIEFEFSWL